MLHTFAATNLSDGFIISTLYASAVDHTWMWLCLQCKDLNLIWGHAHATMSFTAISKQQVLCKYVLWLENISNYSKIKNDKKKNWNKMHANTIYNIKYSLLLYS